MGHAVVEPQPGGEHLAGAHERRGEIDHGDVAAVLDGERAGGTTGAAAHVEDPGAGPGREQARQPIGGRLAAAVKLIGDRQVADRQRVDVLARRGQRRKHPLAEVRPFPVVGHRALPGAW